MAALFVLLCPVLRPRYFFLKLTFTHVLQLLVLSKTYIFERTLQRDIKYILNINTVTMASNLSMRYIVYEIVSCTYSKNNLKSGVRSSVSEPMFFMVEPCESYQLWENLNSFWKIDVGWQLKILLLFVPCLMRNLH